MFSNLEAKSVHGKNIFSAGGLFSSFRETLQYLEIFDVSWLGLDLVSVARSLLKLGLLAGVVNWVLYNVLTASLINNKTQPLM